MNKYWNFYFHNCFWELSNGNKFVFSLCHLIIVISFYVNRIVSNSWNCLDWIFTLNTFYRYFYSQVDIFLYKKLDLFWLDSLKYISILYFLQSFKSFNDRKIIITSWIACFGICCNFTVERKIYICIRSAIDSFCFHSIQ